MANDAASGRPIAFVTGASRGVGKAIALHLARAGFDLAITARTVHPGERREHSPTLAQSDTSPLPGSLEETADAVQSHQVQVLPIAADLLERSSLEAAVDTVLERWGRIDVLVNNGRFVGPGFQDEFVDTPLEIFEKHLEANAMAPIVLAKAVLPSMLERASGTIVNVSSRSGITDPWARIGQGGWGLAYSFSKAAIYRMAGILALELGERGIRAYNLEPGAVATERVTQSMAKFGWDVTDANTPGGPWVPPDVPGAACAWLLSDPQAVEPNGRTIDATETCRQLGLLSGWPAV